MPYIADYALTPLQSGTLLSAFFAGYWVAYIPGGVLADLFGVRCVATGAMLWWSALTAITGAAAIGGREGRGPAALGVDIALQELPRAFDRSCW